MRLISWNVQQGGGQRLKQQIEALTERNPTIVALQEVTARSVSVYELELRRIGLLHVADSFSLAPQPNALTGPRRYGEIIASRWPLRTLPPEEFPIPWPERVLSAVFDSPCGPLELHTTHIPPGATNGWTDPTHDEGAENHCSRPHCDARCRPLELLLRTSSAHLRS
jgi:exodeoxyribonuclease III